MFWSWFILAGSLIGLYFCFNKKLMALLMLELSFLSILFLFFFNSFGVSGMGSFPCMMIFTSFMVMDSVLGLCTLLLSSRNSSLFSYPFMDC